MKPPVIALVRTKLLAFFLGSASMLWAAAVGATPILGTSFNLDFGGSTVPSSLFGASGPNGAWNSIGSLGTTAGILDVAGNTTDVTITLSADGIVGTSGSGDEAALLSDYFFAESGSAWSVEISGLLSGYYNLYFYASNSIVFGDAFAHTCDACTYRFSGTAQQIGSVFISNAPIVMTGTGAEFITGLAGMQIEALATSVPEPSTLILLGSGALGLLGVRRSRKGRTLTKEPSVPHSH